MSDEAKMWIAGMCAATVFFVMLALSGPSSNTTEACGKACAPGGVKVIDWRKCECNPPRAAP